MSPEKKIKIAFSPCPNDTFMFHAMLNGLVDTSGFAFEHHLMDIEELNQNAFEQKYDVTKISFSAFGHLTDKYVLLNSGAALGRNCGPLLISKTPTLAKDINELKIAIPGIYTTANLLLSIMWPEAKNKESVLFSEIEDAVLNDKYDAGLIIHENRFTYKLKGLHKIMDLGEWWENKTGMPIPLGGIVAKESLGLQSINSIERIIKSSIEYAFKYPDASKDFIMQNAQAMDEQVVREHIKLYVNEFSLNLGSEGKNAIRTLLKKGNKSGIFENLV